MGELNHTVSGNIASFRTPSRVPIESLKFHFLPKQAAGTPTPENPIPIEGWTGLNGKRASKNIGHIVNYSASSGQIGETTPQLSNKYGTTLSTVNYSLPDTELVITQTEHDEPTDTSYKNGYFAIWIDNLEFDKRYDISLKVKDVTDPLNAGLSRLRINGPSGGSSQFPAVIDNGTIIYRNVLHAPYVSNGVTANRRGWEFRICGMSMTISEIMVTPANKSDGVFELYSGEVIPIVFPANSKNLYDISSYPLTQGRILWADDGTVDSGYAKFASTLNYIPCENIAGKTVTLNKRPGGWYGGVAFYTDTAGGYSYISGVRNNNQAAGTPITFAVPKNAKYMRFSVPANTTDIQIELGETSTAYEVYSSDNTFYGGYCDPVAGEIVAEYKKHIYDGNIMRIGMNYKVSDRFYGLKSISDCQYGNDGNIISNMLKTQVNHGENVCYQRPSDPGYLIDFGRTTICNLSLEEYDALTVQEQTDLMNNYLANLYENGTPLTVVYKLNSPIHIPIAPQNLKSYLDYNNFWSDTNDITEVTYKIGESKDILQERMKALEFNNYFQGELVFELNGDDAPIDGKWIERVNGWEFKLLGEALYDATNKVYDFSGRSLASTGSENTNKLSMGHHFRIEWDLYYKRKLCNSSIFFDICSLTSADKAIGIGLLTKSDNSTISFNWKLNGNSSNPWTGGSEQRISPVTIPMDDNFTHFTGFHEIIPGSDGYDRARVKVNDHIIKYTTPIPKANYSGPWQSQIKAISVGAGVYNIAALQREQNGDSSYYCECKIKSIKIYKYD